MFGIDNSPEQRAAREALELERTKAARERERLLKMAAENAARGRELRAQAERERTEIELTAHARLLDKIEAAVLDALPVSGPMFLDSPALANSGVWRDLIAQVAPMSRPGLMQDIALRRERGRLVDFLATATAIAQMEAARRDAAPVSP